MITEAIARCALSGVTVSLEKAVPGLKVIDCDMTDNPSEVEIVVEMYGSKRRFKFIVREYLHYAD